eukprot:jgi/Hompol1/2595/HPOL_006062-RA
MRAAPRAIDDDDEEVDDDAEEGDEAELDDEAISRLRSESLQRLQSAWQRIFERYGRSFEGESDEIDLASGRIVVNNGFLRTVEPAAFGDSLVAVASHSIAPTSYPSDISVKQQSSHRSSSTSGSSSTSAAFDSDLKHPAVNRNALPNIPFVPLVSCLNSFYHSGAYGPLQVTGLTISQNPDLLRADPIKPAAVSKTRNVFRQIELEEDPLLGNDGYDLQRPCNFDIAQTAAKLSRHSQQSRATSAHKNSASKLQVHADRSEDGAIPDQISCDDPFDELLTQCMFGAASVIDGDSLDEFDDAAVVDPSKPEDMRAHDYSSSRKEYDEDSDDRECGSGTFDSSDDDLVAQPLSGSRKTTVKNQQSQYQQQKHKEPACFSLPNHESSNIASKRAADADTVALKRFKQTSAKTRRPIEHYSFLSDDDPEWI